MLPEVAAGFSSLNAARQIMGAILELRQGEAVREKVQELREKIGDAQDALHQLGEHRSLQAEKIRQLEAKILEFEKWGQQEQRYELTALAPNVMAMRLKAEASAGEPPHLLCANCFVDRKKRYLLQTHKGDGYNAFACAGCNQIISFSTPGQYRSSVSDDFAF